MPLSEFDLIERFFAHGEVQRDDVILGIGDDAALLRVAPGHHLASATCTLVEDSDFRSETPPHELGHRVLAISLTRLAATAAEPAWATLALTLPRADTDWVAAFSTGLLALAKRHSVQLVGGDTTRGPRQITLISSGCVPQNELVRCDRMQPGDLIYVTGTLGKAGLALLALQGEIRCLSAREKDLLNSQLQNPQPPVAAGMALRGRASAAIDVGDGLYPSLQGLLARLGLGATIYAERLPISPVLAATLSAAGGWMLPLTAPGDCELCFTIPPANQAAVERRFAEPGLSCTWVGVVERSAGLRCVLEDGTYIAD